MSVSASREETRFSTLHKLDLVLNAGTLIKDSVIIIL